MKAIIPAAGFGTRFLPLTKAQPKEMLPVVNKPTIQWVIEEAVDAGITEIAVITGKHKQAIENHFNPIVLHYTTSCEEEFADWAPEFFCLSSSEEEREDSDIGGGGIYNVNPMMREELAMSMW